MSVQLSKRPNATYIFHKCNCSCRQKCYHATLCNHLIYPPWIMATSQSWWCIWCDVPKML